MSARSVCGMISILMGAVFCFVAFRDYRDARISESWVETPAQLVSVAIEYEPKVRSKGRDYFLRVRYFFDLPEGRIHGERYTMGYRWLSRDEARERKRALRPGATITVYRDPEDPNRSAMLRGGPEDMRRAGRLATAGTGFLLLGILLFRRVLAAGRAPRLI